jgi:hypothetical protein
MFHKRTINNNDSKILFQALPALGKTTAVVSYAGQALDSDVLMTMLLGDVGPKVWERVGFTYNQYLKELAKLTSLMFGNYPTLKFVASNTFYKCKGFKNVLIGVEPELYIDVIIANERSELITLFGKDKLFQWALESLDLANLCDEVIMLNEGEYVTDVIDKYYNPDFKIMDGDSDD